MSISSLVRVHHARSEDNRVSISFTQNASQNCNSSGNHFDLHENLFMIIRTWQFSVSLEFNMLGVKRVSELLF